MYCIPNWAWVRKVMLIFSTELATRQHCRDNVTIFRGHKTIDYCILFIFVVGTSLRHRDCKFVFFFLSLKLYYYTVHCTVYTLSRCRVVTLQSYTIVTCPALILSLYIIGPGARVRGGPTLEDSRASQGHEDARREAGCNIL